VAIYVAVDGLNTWKNKLKGTTKFELAHRVQTETYKLRDVIGYMRNMQLDRERNRSLQEEGIMDIDDPDFGFMIEKAILQSRWKRVLAVLSDYESLSAQAEALLKKEVKENLNAIYGSVRSLNASLDEYLMYKQKKYHEKDEWRLVIHTVERAVYASNDEDDEFKKDLEKKIQALEESLDEYTNLKK
ncbi:MAG: hypothetical protein WA997_03135, partial [Anaerolineales bacterium]